MFKGLMIGSLVKRYASNFLANTLQQGLRFLLLYLAAKVLGPAEFAVVSFVLLITGYLLNSNLGAINGIKRQVPLVYSRKGNRFVLSSFFSILNFNWIATFIASLAAALVLYFYYRYDLGVSILMVFIALSFNTYFAVQTYFTCTGSWLDLFRLQLLCAGLLIIVSLSLFFESTPIFFFTYASSFALAALFFFVKKGYQLRFDRAIIRENIGVGFPVMISGFIYLLFQTTDRLIVSHFYTDEDFGYYSFAWVLVLTLNLVVNMSSEIILQKAATYHSHVHSKGLLLKYLLKYSLLVQLALCIVTVLLIAAAKYAIPVYFNEYTPAIPVITNLIIAYLIQQLALGAANFYYIIGRQKIYNLMLVLSLIVNAALLLGAVTYPSEMPGIASLSRLYIVSSCIYIIFMYLPLLKKDIL